MMSVLLEQIAVNWGGGGARGQRSTVCMPHYYPNILKKVIPVAGPPLWSSGQSSGFDSRRYKIFSEVVGLERGSLSLVSSIEELLESESSGSDLRSRNLRIRQ
jgi:hypothetical protein